jgi:large subunit ribosomal protein L36e
VLIFLTKLSILLLYLRLFVPMKTWKSKTYLTIHFVLWFNVLFYTANTFGEIFYCTPREKEWNPKLPGHCVDVYVLIIGSAAINAFSDMMMIIIPFIVIWRLHMPTRRKLGLSIVFAFGIL